MPKHDKELGKKLYMFRKSKMLTQEQIASLLGVSQEAYGKAERGITKPYNYIDKLAAHFNIDRTEIDNTSTDRIINNYGHMDVGFAENISYNSDSDTMKDVVESLKHILFTVNRLVKKIEVANIY